MLFTLLRSGARGVNVARPGRQRRPRPHQGGHYVNPPVFDTIRRQHGDELQFAIVNGDITHEELRDGTIDGVRANYRLYYSRGRAVRVTKTHP